MSVQTTIIKCAMRVICPLALNSPEDQFTLLHVPGTCSTEINFLGSRYMAGVQHQISGSGCHKLPNKVTYAIGIESDKFLAQTKREASKATGLGGGLVNYVAQPSFIQVQGEWLLTNLSPYYENYSWAKHQSILVYGLGGIRINAGYPKVSTNLQFVVGLSTDILYSQSMAFVAKIGFVLGAYSLLGDASDATKVCTALQNFVSFWHQKDQVFQWELGVRIGNFWF